MALERIDPLLLEDCYAVDHLLRYALGCKFAGQKRILDAACGLGFGSVLLMHRDAKAVVGVDISEEAIETCKARWTHPKLSFEARDLEALKAEDYEAFDLITSFETLEHVQHPEKVIAGFHALLAGNGLLMGSVPAETDLMESNEFHFHHFSAEALRALLQAQFKHVLLYRQDFRIQSRLRPDGADFSAEPISWQEEKELEIDFGRSGSRSDSFVFLASNEPLPEVDLHSAASSRQAWLRLHSAYGESSRELKAVSEKYSALFLEHGDLKVKFANMLGWGQWHYEKWTGEDLSDTDLDRIQKSTTKREIDLREQLAILKEENRVLKSRMAEAEAFMTQSEQAHRSVFEKSAQSLEDPN